MPASLVSIALLGAALAAEPPDPSCLAVSDIVSLAAAVDPRVALANAEIAAADADFDDALALRRPSIEAFGRSSVGDTGLTTSQIENQVGLRVSQRLFDFGDARLARASARASRLAAVESVRASASEAALEAVQLSIDIQEARAQLIATEDRASYFQAQRDSVADMAQRGLATGAELAEIEAELARSLADRIELEFQRDRALAALALQLDRAAPRLCAADLFAGELASGLSSFAADGQWLDAVARRNPSVAALRERTRSDEASSRRESRARLPALDLVGVTSYAYDDVRDEWSYRDRVGIDISVPLYSGSALSARADRAAARAASGQALLRQMERQVRLEAVSAQRQILALEAQIIRLEAVEASKAAQFDLVTQELDRGVATLPRLIEVRLEFEAATLAVISARHEKLRRQAELLALTASLPGLPPPPVLDQREAIWGWEPDPAH